MDCREKNQSVGDNYLETWEKWGRSHRILLRNNRKRTVAEKQPAFARTEIRVCDAGRPQRLFTVEHHIILHSVGKVTPAKFDDVFKKTRALSFTKK